MTYIPEINDYFKLSTNAVTSDIKNIYKCTAHNMFGVIGKCTKSDVHILFHYECNFIRVDNNET